jgi:glycine hydroxymethyltransferase
VTSCAIDQEGYLTGQAFINFKNSIEGTQISIFQGSPEVTGKPPAEMKMGDRATLPGQATVVSRFPK